VPKIRILVVDDAVVVRRILTNTLGEDPELEVVASAANGKIALARIPQLNPDIVILDIEMPEMNGVECLREIRRIYPKLPVIMFSTLTQRGAAATFDALALGANDYVTKPSNVGGVTQAITAIRESLVPKIKVFCSHIATPQPVPAPTPKPVPTLLPPKSFAVSRPQHSGRLEVVAIGVSTGGPNALSELIPQFPADFPVPIVIVQHMPPIFTNLLAERLSAQSRIKVVEAAAGMDLHASGAWLAPGNFHVTLRRDGTFVRVATNQDPPENSCRPAVDVLFRSVAKVYGSSALGVVMTGMGQDGLRGSENIREAGGQILVQDEATSVVWGMPGYVARAGLADKVLPLPQLGAEIVRRVLDSRFDSPRLLAGRIG
jgi:two-component system, chemotaxis family, protein-glutamate methylesterase/glutaminase